MEVSHHALNSATRHQACDKAVHCGVGALHSALGGVSFLVGDTPGREKNGRVFEAPRWSTAVGKLL